MIKTTLKDILRQTVLNKIVYMYIYYEWDYEKTLQYYYDDETIKLFNKLFTYKEIVKALQEGIKLYNEQGYF